MIFLQATWKITKYKGVHEETWTVSSKNTRSSLVQREHKCSKNCRGADEAVNHFLESKFGY